METDKEYYEVKSQSSGDNESIITGTYLVLASSFKNAEDVVLTELSKIYPTYKVISIKKKRIAKLIEQDIAEQNFYSARLSMSIVNESKGTIKLVTENVMIITEDFPTSYNLLSDYIAELTDFDELLSLNKVNYNDFLIQEFEEVEFDLKLKKDE